MSLLLRLLNNSPPVLLPVGQNLSNSVPQFRKQWGYAQFAQNLLLTTLAVVAVASTEVRAPLQVQQNKVTQQPVYATPNLLTTTLSTPVVAKPFLNTDLQTVRASTRTPEFSYPNLLVGTLAQTQAQVPFSQTQWVNPQTIRSAIADIYGYPLALKSVSQTPFSQTQWVNPSLLARGAQSTDTRNLLTGTLAPVAVETVVSRAPFVVQQNRLLQQLPIATGNLLVTTLAQTQSTPFSQTQWANPQATRTATADSYASSIALLTAVTQAPFSQTQWANPQITRTATADSYASSIALLTSVTQAPFSQTQWSNPQATRTATADSYASSIALLTAVTQAPFSQTQWSNPQLPRLTTASDQVVNMTLTVLSTIPGTPVFGSTQPNPQIVVSSAAQFSTPNLLTNLLPPVVPPATDYNDYHRRYRRISYR